MASVYTTSRGKNKKNKAKDQGKDNRNNIGNKINTDLAKALAPHGEPFNARAFEIRANVASTSSRGQAERERLLRSLAERSCSGPDCPSQQAGKLSAGGVEGGGSGGGGPASSEAAPPPAPLSPPAADSLKKCACGLVSYCCTACQKGHWDEHKEACRAKRKELADAAQAAGVGER